MDLLRNLFGITTKYSDWDRQGELPLYIALSYDFVLADLSGCRCIILSPKGELATVPALIKQIDRIQNVENVPVVIRLSSVSPYRRNKMIEEGIPFITGKQVYLPFLGTYLTKEDRTVENVNKLMFSAQQLVLLYLYSNCKRLYVSEATQRLPFTAMTMSRAVRQLEATGLFYTTKDGVNKVIESDYSGKELYNKVKEYLSSPVRIEGYICKSDVTSNMVLAGDMVLAEETILSPSKVMTYAIYARNFVKDKVAKELVDFNDQVKLELWEYDPKLLSQDSMADRLSVALSFKNQEDERIEMAVDEMLDKVWE